MSKNKSSVSRSLLNSSMNSESEEVEGNPWAVVPIKTRLYAKDTIEIELSNRKVTKLVCFDQFENLEALWLNNNKLKRIENLDKNFRLKELYLSKNRITTLEGSLSVMKFLTVLLLDNNKLRNLDKQLSLLSKLPFLKNLNLFSNPLAEEPEYRYRVIFNMPKLQILDRHKITDFEKTKAEKIVPEFMNPLSDKANKSKIVNKLNNSQTTNYSSTLLNSTNNSSIANDKVSKQLKLRRPIVHSQKILMSISKSGLKPSKPDPNKHKKAYEKLSITEKEMFIECNQILKRKEAEAKILKEKIEYQLKERELRDFDLPHNKAIEENNKRYLRDDCYDCPELEINEIRRLFNFYDPNSKGTVKRKDLDYLFYDIKKNLEKNGLNIKEKRFFNYLLNFSANNKEEFIPIKEVKMVFYEILKGNISNDQMEEFNKARNLDEIEYLKKLSGVDENYTNDYEVIMSRIKNSKKPLTLREKADRLIETGKTIQRTGSEIIAYSIKSGKSRSKSKSMSKKGFSHFDKEKKSKIVIEEEKPVRSRKDIYTKHCYHKPKEEYTVILNENKLASLYS